MAIFVEFIDPETGVATKMHEVDEAICAMMEVPCNPRTWYLDWFNNIGPLLAFDLRDVELRDMIRTNWGSYDKEMKAFIKIAEFLETHYTINSWRDR